MFGGVRPSFQKVDEITFTRPVDVGDLLRLTSTVVFAANLDEQRSGEAVRQRLRVLLDFSACSSISIVGAGGCTNTYTRMTRCLMHKVLTVA